MIIYGNQIQLFPTITWHPRVMMNVGYTINYYVLHQIGLARRIEIQQKHRSQNTK